MQDAEIASFEGSSRVGFRRRCGRARVYNRRRSDPTKLRFPVLAGGRSDRKRWTAATFQTTQHTLTAGGRCHPPAARRPCSRPCGPWRRPARPCTRRPRTRPHGPLSRPPATRRTSHPPARRQMPPSPRCTRPPRRPPTPPPWRRRWAPSRPCSTWSPCQTS